MKKISVFLVWAWPQSSGEISVEVIAGATIREILDSARVEANLPQAIVGELNGYGVWGRARQDSFVVRNQDRIELYRALTADPKEARRKRVGVKNAKSPG